MRLQSQLLSDKRFDQHGSFLSMVVYKTPRKVRRIGVSCSRSACQPAAFKTLQHQLHSWDRNRIDVLPSIDIIEATIHAVMRSQNPDLSDFRGFVLPSILYRTSKEYY